MAEPPCRNVAGEAAAEDSVDDAAQTGAAILVCYDTDLYDLNVCVGDRTAVIQTTSNHLFWDATTDRWVKAATLKYGTHLRTPAGRYATVAAGYTPKATASWMWDLAVPGNNDHDFYINTVAAAVLVHNCDDLDSMSPSGRAADRVRKQRGRSRNTSSEGASRRRPRQASQVRLRQLT
jgi:hypothetical protein